MATAPKQPIFITCIIAELIWKKNPDLWILVQLVRAQRKKQSAKKLKKRGDLIALLFSRAVFRAEL